MSTRALKPEQAIVLSASANFLGAFLFGTAVAGTIGSGIVHDNMILANGSTVLISALIGAITWDLITWWAAIPSSSSHALIGGLIGGAAAAGGLDAVQWNSFAAKVLVPLVSSPVLGWFIALTLMIILLNLIGHAVPRRLGRLGRSLLGRNETPGVTTEADHGTSPDRISARFRKLQVLSAAYMALSHGSNDAQKTMGIMTLALFNAGAIDSKAVPWPVIALAASAMGIGTAMGGWRIMKTMGQRVVKLDPVHGFAAETTAASIIVAASHFGMPVSTTHVISGSIMGVGTSDRIKGVRWAVARNIATAWILTIPASAIVAAMTYFVLHLIGL